MTKRVVKRKQALSFQQMDLSPAMANNLVEIGYHKPTPIQAGLIPLALEEWDVIGQARTGTGKNCRICDPDSGDA